MAITLSVRQPWAWLIIAGHKDIENREWRTNHCGPLVIHAGVTPAPEEDIAFVKSRYGIRVPKSALLYGGIIGVVDLVECVTVHKSRWFDGRPYFGWVLANPRPLEFTRWRGMPGLFHTSSP